MFFFAVKLEESFFCISLWL